MQKRVFLEGGLELGPNIFSHKSLMSSQVSESWIHFLIVLWIITPGYIHRHFDKDIARLNDWLLGLVGRVD